MALSDNLVLYLPLDEGTTGNAIDAHTGGYDFSEVGGTIGSGTGHHGGTARDFEAGDENHFTHAQNGDLNTGAAVYSIAFWMKPETTVAGTAIMDRWNAGVFDILLWYTPTPTIAFYNSNGASFGQITSSVTISAGNWYFVAIGRKDSTTELWISIDAGTPEVKPDYSSGGNSGATHDFNIGGLPGGGALYYDGLLQHFAMWQRDIRSDLAALYNGGSGVDYDYIINPPVNPHHMRLPLLGVG